MSSDTNWAKQAAAYLEQKSEGQCRSADEAALDVLQLLDTFEENWDDLMEEHESLTVLDIVKRVTDLARGLVHTLEKATSDPTKQKGLQTQLSDLIQETQDSASEQESDQDE